VKAILASIAFIAAAGVASAASVNPVSYDMENGGSGSYNYWDDTYNGTGDNTANYAALSGGTGDLTDGIIATQNWNAVEAPVGPNGPYVGWRNKNPVLDFQFGQTRTFTSVVFHFDVSRSGGVDQIEKINLVGFGSANLPIYASASPTSYTFDLGQGFSTDELKFQLHRKGDWIMLSEVEFNAIAAVPVPAAGWLLIGGLGALAAVRRRKRG
jgi:hypothetical protein